MKDVVVSVPHSGTRTLVEYLDLAKNSPRGRWLHFGYDMDEPKIKSGHYHLHIPVRHPLKVAKSWARRDKNIKGLLSAYESMFEHIETQEHTLYKMEDMPKLDGHLEYPGKEPQHWILEEYEGLILVNVVAKHREFFEHYYG